MIRHQTSYWLTLKPAPGAGPDGFGAAVEAAREDMARFDIVPSEPDGESVPDEARFEVDPDYGTIEYVSGVEDAVKDLAARFPDVLFHLEICDEEDRSDQAGVLFHGARSAASRASMLDPDGMDVLELALDDPGAAALRRVEARLADARDLARSLGLPDAARHVDDAIRRAGTRVEYDLLPGTLSPKDAAAAAASHRSALVVCGDWEYARAVHAAWKAAGTPDTYLIRPGYMEKDVQSVALRQRTDMAARAVSGPDLMPDSGLRFDAVYRTLAHPALLEHTAGLAVPVNGTLTVHAFVPEDMDRPAAWTLTKLLGPKGGTT